VPNAARRPRVGVESEETVTGILHSVRSSLTLSHDTLRGIWYSRFAADANVGGWGAAGGS
jgi:hypothetical protein